MVRKNRKWVSAFKVITDVMMDKMSDGFDFSRKLKSDVKYKKILILIVTAVGEKNRF